MSPRPFSHHLAPRTLLGVGISAPGVYSFEDAPRDYGDFCALYSRWLTGPLPAHVLGRLDGEERSREAELNWRVFGHAVPTLMDLERRGWRPNLHPGPLGLWCIRSLDLSGVAEEVRANGALLNRAIQAAKTLPGRTLARVPAGLSPRTWARTLAALRPEALVERTLVEVWARNVVTDTGATAMLKNTWNSAGSAVGIMSHIVIAAGNQGYALQTGGAITSGSGAQTSIATAGGVQVANMPANPATVSWSYGTPNAEIWTLRTATPGAIGASSILVVSQTAGAVTHSAGDYIVNVPSTSDNPSSVAGSADSGALSAGAFTYSGSGAGNRQVVISFVFPTSPTTAAGSYTEAYTSNAGTIATGSTGSHIIFPPAVINSTTSLTMTVTEKV